MTVLLPNRPLIQRVERVVVLKKIIRGERGIGRIGEGGGGGGGGGPNPAEQVRFVVNSFFFLFIFDKNDTKLIKLYYFFFFHALKGDCG